MTAAWVVNSYMISVFKVKMSGSVIYDWQCYQRVLIDTVEPPLIYSLQLSNNSVQFTFWCLQWLNFVFKYLEIRISSVFFG